MEGCDTHTHTHAQVEASLSMVMSNEALPRFRVLELVPSLILRYAINIVNR